MHALLIGIHVVVCLILIFVVLLQAGKGADIGASFGGSSQTLFGARGATSFLSKMTAAAAVVYMLTSLGLSMVGTTGGASSVIKDEPAKKEMPAMPGAGSAAKFNPAAPAGAPAPAPAQAPAMPAAPAGAK